MNDTEGERRSQAETFKVILKVNTVGLLVRNILHYTRRWSNRGQMHYVTITSFTFQVMIWEKYSVFHR